MLISARTQLLEDQRQAYSEQHEKNLDYRKTVLFNQFFKPGSSPRRIEYYWITFIVAIFSCLLYCPLSTVAMKYVHLCTPQTVGMIIDTVDICSFTTHSFILVHSNAWEVLKRQPSRRGIAVSLSGCFPYGVCNFSLDFKDKWFV